MNTKFNNKKTITRVFLFIFALIGVALNMILNIYIDGGTGIYWFIFWTHLSNLGVLIWATFALYASLAKNEKVEDFISNWFIKGLVTTFILETGIMFMVFAYIPTVIGLTHNPDINEVANVIQANGGNDYFVRNHYSWYAFIAITSTTLVHLIVPTLFMVEFFVSKGYNTKIDKKDIIDKSLILFIFPSLYFVWAVLLNALGVPGPYPVLNFSNVFTDASQEPYSNLHQFISIFLDLMAGIAFIIFSYFLMKWSNKLNN